MADKHKSYDIFKFKEPVPESIYRKLYRSRDPVEEIKKIEEAVGKELVDRKKARKDINLLKLLLNVVFIMVYIGSFSMSYSCLLVKFLT